MNRNQNITQHDYFDKVNKIRDNPCVFKFDYDYKNYYDEMMKEIDESSNEIDDYVQFIDIFVEHRLSVYVNHHYYDMLKFNLFHEYTKYDATIDYYRVYIAFRNIELGYEMMLYMSNDKYFNSYNRLFPTYHQINKCYYYLLSYIIQYLDASFFQRLVKGTEKNKKLKLNRFKNNEYSDHILYIGLVDHGLEIMFQEDGDLLFEKLPQPYNRIFKWFVIG